MKSAFKTKFAEGAYYGTYAPLGYKKHPDIKGKLLVDEETKWIVEKIFSLAYQGYGSAKMILSRLVDTFFSRILYPMLPLSGNHSIAVV